MISFNFNLVLPIVHHYQAPQGSLTHGKSSLSPACELLFLCNRRQFSLINKMTWEVSFFVHELRRHILDHMLSSNFYCIL